MNMPAGVLDRRIQVEQCIEVRDAAGDVIRTDWGPPADWPRGGKRWAHRKDGRPVEVVTEQQVLRQIDTTWTLRADTYSAVIAPETFRFVYKGRIFEIIGLSETAARADGLAFLCSSRPDQRGPRGPEDASK